MRRFLIALACLATAACDQVPALQNLVGGNSNTVRPAELDTFLRGGMIWCYNYEASTQTCEFIERVRQVTSDGFLLEQYMLMRVDQGAIKIQTVQRLRYRHVSGQARVCSSASETLRTMRLYPVVTAEASIDANERALPDDVTQRFIGAMSEEATRAGTADESCFGWTVITREPQWDVTEIRYVDGIEQPDDSRSVVRLFPIETDFLRLRPRVD